MEEEIMEEDFTYVNVDKKNKPLFKNIDIFKFINEENKEKEFDKKDQFIFAMGYGLYHDNKKPLDTKGYITRISYLKPEDEALINAVALYDTNDIDILKDRKKVYEIADQYANGGIELLNDEVEGTQFGSFDKKFEKILKDIYSKIESREKD